MKIIKSELLLQASQSRIELFSDISKLFPIASMGNQDDKPARMGKKAKPISRGCGKGIQFVR